MFANLVNKYGLVPKSAYPESANSRNSDAFKQYLNTQLREFASDLRDRHTAGTSLDELRGDGYFDCDTVRVDQLFGTEFTFDKARGLEYGDCPSNHAMTLTGVNLDEDGRPNRWKVENSWDKDNGQDGYYVASDAWFDRYVTELIIRKEYLDEATREILADQPVELEPWEPLTNRSR